MECWICKQKNFLGSYCECTNNFQYAHKKCILKWYCKYNNHHCRFCKSQYKISFCNKVLYQIYFLCNEISQYNLYSGVKWDEYDF